MTIYSKAAFKCVPVVVKTPMTWTQAKRLAEMVYAARLRAQGAAQRSVYSCFCAWVEVLKRKKNKLAEMKRLTEATTSLWLHDSGPQHMILQNRVYFRGKPAQPNVVAKQLNKRFLLASRTGNVLALRTLLSTTGELDVNKAFRTACAHGHADVAKHLLSLTGSLLVDVHSEDDFAMRAACYRGHGAVIWLLLSLKKEREISRDTLNNVFCSACERGKIELVRLLLDIKGKREVNVRAAFLKASFQGRWSVLEELFKLRDHRRIDDVELLSVALMRARETKADLIVLQLQRWLRCIAQNKTCS